MGVAAVQGASVVVVGATLGALVGGRAGLVVGLVVSLAPAVVFARVLAGCRPYPSGGRGVGLALLDATWGSLTTWVSAWYLLVLRARRNPPDRDRSHGSGLVHLCDPAIPGYATTIGIVTAGCSGRVEPHERVHVLQARIFGPLYLPLVGLGFVVATLVPYWLISSRSRGRVRDLSSFFVHGVYPNTWHEWWAYRVAPTRRTVAG